MRDLTEEELKLAPSWTTHYFIFDNGDILFECMNYCTIYEEETGELLDGVSCSGVCDRSKPIRRKTFDITKHEFSDCNAKVMFITRSEKVCFKGEIYKDDAIAIAKALGVTGEDLC